MRISDWSSDVCSSDLHPRQAQEYPGSGEGLLWPPQEHHPHRAAGSRKGWPIRLSRSQGKEAQLPCALDSAHQRRRTHGRSEEHTSELQSLMRISYAVFCLKKKTHVTNSESQSQHSTNQFKHHSTITTSFYHFNTNTHKTDHH